MYEECGSKALLHKGLLLRLTVSVIKPLRKSILSKLFQLRATSFKSTREKMPTIKRHCVISKCDMSMGSVDKAQLDRSSLLMDT